MPAPYSYLGGVQPVDLSPQVQSIAANLGAGLAAALQTSAAQQQAQLQAQQQAAMQAQLAEDMRDYAAAPSIEKFGLLLGRYPQMKKQLESVQSRLTEEDRQGALSFIAPTLSYLQGGQNDLAIENIKRRNEALANSSVPNRAALIANGNAMISAIERGDEGVNSAVGALIRDYAMASGTTDPAKFSELQAQLPFAAGYAEGRAEKLLAEAGKAKTQEEAEADRIRAEIGLDEQQAKESRARVVDMARRYNLAVQELEENSLLKMLELEQKGGEVAPQWFKRIDQLTQDASASSLEASRALELAGEMERVMPGAGVKGRISDAINRALGTENSIDLLRKRYVDFRNSGVARAMSSLKGASSDRDVALYLQGFPSEFADPKVIATFLRGQAKASLFESAMNEAQVEWIAQNGKAGPTNAVKDMSVLGYRVPRGMSLADFRKKYGEDILGAAIAEKDKQEVRGGSLGGYFREPAGAVAQPAAPSESPMYIFP